MNIYLPEDDGSWADKVLGEREAAQLRSRFNDIVDNAVTQKYLTITIMPPVEKMVPLLDEMRAYCEEYEGELEQMLMALGYFMCGLYVLDGDMEYDEDLTDHAKFFGTIESDDDDEDDDEDVGDVSDE